MNILLIEDDLITSEVLRHRLGKDMPESHFEHVGTLADARHLLEDKTFDLCILDLGLPDSDGIDTLWNVRKLRPSMTVIVYSASNDPELIRSCIEVGGAQDYVVKGKELSYERLYVASLHRAKIRIFEEALLMQTQIASGVFLGTQRRDRLNQIIVAFLGAFILFGMFAYLMLASFGRGAPDSIMHLVSVALGALVTLLTTKYQSGSNGNGKK